METIPADDLVKLAGMLAPVIDGDALKPGTCTRIGTNTKVVSLERFRPTPSYLNRALEFREASEFVSYYNAYGGDEAAGFATIRPLRVRVMLDYGKRDAPLWGVHRAEFCPEYSPAWLAWAACNKKPMSHTEFAEFIETRIAEITQPDAATILEMSTGFEASANSTFASAVRLSSGSMQLQFSTEVRGTARNSQMQVPSEFMISLPVYEFHAHISLMARLRYRLKEGHLLIWYEFVRLDEALADHDTRLLIEIRKAVPRVSLGKVTHSLAPINGREESNT